MKILGLISSRNDPASRFRIMQYKKTLALSGHKLNCHIPFPPKESDPSKIVLRNKKLWHACQVVGRSSLLLSQFKYDIIWQNRLLLNDNYGIEKYYKIPFVFDFDDSIWLNEGKNQVDLAISKATMLFAGNDFLAEYGSRLNQNVKIVPSVIDTSYLKPLQKNHKLFTLGWIGTKSNFKYLALIKEAVLDFLTQEKNSRFIIISSEPPDIFSFDNERIIFKQWSAEKENEQINEFSVGLMPLTNDEWTKGKCSFKMLQYMACGVPVIVSPVGQNNKVLIGSNVGFAASNKEEWIKAMKDLFNDSDLYKRFKETGRLYIEEKYSLQKWTLKICEYFQALANNKK